MRDGNTAHETPACLASRLLARLLDLQLIAIADPEEARLDLEATIRTPGRDLAERIVTTLLASPQVEEVFGSDAALLDAISALLPST